MHKNLRFLYITTENKDQASDLGRKIIDADLAACVNIIPAMESIYKWENEIHTNSEAILIVKTHISKVQAVTHFLKENHSYECPCVISLNIAEDEGNPEYLKWLYESATERT
ncbi:MAG TPA: divalent-cation tolerance protein CutA [Balneola sp.]|jgi:periplasmic divalent cation tolerance protein|nr:divalent-cation tolerance protein CutA [Balneola sp.]HCT54757.1 divalent-cation tolerance protein CutA [Balneola sp.]|tara:strand:- start:947 stop:1282 length:336 start_codon:yes stop_codon:yes gene_type:complete